MALLVAIPVRDEKVGVEQDRHSNHPYTISSTPSSRTAFPHGRLIFSSRSICFLVRGKSGAKSSATTRRTSLSAWDRSRARLSCCVRGLPSRLESSARSLSSLCLSFGAIRTVVCMRIVVYLVYVINILPQD